MNTNSHFTSPTLSEEATKQATLSFVNTRNWARTSVEALINFDDRTFNEKFEEMCPVISTLIKAAAGYSPEGPKADKSSCVHNAMFCCLKRDGGDCRSSVVAYRNDQLLVAFGVKKKAFKWFGEMGITNSDTTVLKKHKLLCQQHDSPVLQWKSIIEIRNLLKGLKDYHRNSRTDMQKKHCTR